MASVPTQPPADLYGCAVQLSGWKLHASFLIRREGRDLGNVMDVAVRGAIADARKYAQSGRVDQVEIPAAIRRDIERMELDPRPPRPASERLIEAVLEDAAVAEGCLAWRFLVILILKSQAPWTVLRSDQIAAPMSFRRGEEGESLRDGSSVLDCAGLPVLADADGVVASPWALPDHAELDGCARPIFVCFLPRTLFREVEPMAHMGRVIWTTWAYGFDRQRTYAPSRAGV